MLQFNMTVKQFADHFLPNNSKVKIIKTYETLFVGTLDELYCHGSNLFDLIVAMIEADENKICLSCR